MVSRYDRLHFKTRRIVPNYQVEVEDSSAILKLVAMNIGISFTPKQALRNLDKQIVAIPINNEHCYREIGLAYKNLITLQK